MGSIEWDLTLSNKEWFLQKKNKDWKEYFSDNGYLVVEDIISTKDLDTYRQIYDDLLQNKINAKRHRHDLGSHAKKSLQNEENICQIMWPSYYVKELREGPFHQRAMMVAQYLLGDDLNFDFDMMISKAPYSNTVTPMHQDESYWLTELYDKRAVSVWMGLDDTTIDNGCLWFNPETNNKSLLKFKKAAVGHHAICLDEEMTEKDLIPVAISAGSCTLHGGRTVHYSRGNTTAFQRRGLITNYRPKAMIDLERQLKYDHGLDDGITQLTENN